MKLVNYLFVHTKVMTQCENINILINIKYSKCMILLAELPTISYSKFQYKSS